MRHHTTSCGCVNYSIGEKNIVNILEKNNIPFKKEYSFPDLIGKKNVLYRYDFAIFNKDNKIIRLIEFDGRQHTLDYTPWGEIDTLEERQKRDKQKDLYALQHNIPLIRIPYTKRDNLNL